MTIHTHTHTHTHTHNDFGVVTASTHPFRYVLHAC